jgi:integrase
MYWFRKRVPDDIFEIINKRIVSQSLRTKDPKEAASRFLAVAKAVDDEWRQMRRPGPPPAPESLSEKQIEAICGEFYRWTVAQHDQNPTFAERWRKKLEFLDTITRPRADGRPVRPGGAGGYFQNEVDEFLKSKGIELDAAERWRVIERASKAGYMAMETLLRNAKRDYSAHPDERRFPEWKGVESQIKLRDHGLYVSRDWDAYAKEYGIKPATIKAYRPILDKLTAFLGKGNLALVTPQIVVDWKHHLLGENLSAKRIGDVYFAAARSFFTWGIENGQVDANPFANIRIKIPKAAKLRPKSLQEDETDLILSESLREEASQASPGFRAAKRWIPWIMAYTGARVNEITQLRREDVRKRTLKLQDGDRKWVEEVWTINLTPEAGSTKTNEARETPLHPHLVEQGFPDFVLSREPGPLFFDPNLRKDGSDPANAQHQKVGDKLAQWVREIGVADGNVKPNHGWRHRFNREARKVRMDPEVRDAIKGHKPRTEGELYGDDVPIEAKWLEIKRLPKIEVEPATGPKPGAEFREERSRKRMETAKRARVRNAAAMAKSKAAFRAGGKGADAAKLPPKLPPKLARKAHMLLKPLDDDHDDDP